MKLVIKFKAVMQQEIPDSDLEKIMKLHEVYTKEDLCKKLAEILRQQSGAILTKSFNTDYALGFDFEVYESK